MPTALRNFVGVRASSNCNDDRLSDAAERFRLLVEVRC